MAAQIKSAPLPSPRVPPPIRVAAKLVMARLPIPYKVWWKLGLLRHGEMVTLAYAEGIVRRHLEVLSVAPAGMTFVELGPGDSIMSALVLRARGAARTILVDVTRAATDDVTVYRDAALALTATHGDPGWRPAGWRTLDDVLTDCNAEYVLAADGGVRTLPDASVDMVFSHAVLEHVRRAEMAPLLADTRRILKPGGVASHRVDFRDHLGGGLANMRYTSAWWEQEWVANCGFYTNRIRLSELVALFEANGLRTDVVTEDHWPKVPIDRSALAPEFASLTDADLLVSGADLVARPS